MLIMVKTCSSQEDSYKNTPPPLSPYPFADSLDFVTDWLQEASDDLTKLRRINLSSPFGGGPAASGIPVLCPVSVQNQAYLKLLKWDHVHRPFPEVGVYLTVLISLYSSWWYNRNCWVSLTTSQAQDIKSFVGWGGLRW